LPPLRVALENGRISAVEYNLFGRIRVLRNPLVRFRRPLSSNTIEERMLATDALPSELVEQDAPGHPGTLPAPGQACGLTSE